MRPIHPCRIVAAPHYRKPRVAVLRRSHLRRHHADDGEILIVQIDRATNHTRIAIECALPETIADHDDWRRAHFIFVFAESAADFRRQANDIEKISSDRSARHPFRFATRNAAQISRFLVCGGEMFEDRIVVSPVEVVGQRD